MISHLSGSIASRSRTHLVIDVGGVGYLVHIPLSSYEAFSGSDGSVKVLTYLHVREDALALYGFATEPERELFLLLISVSGIGPPMAQRILSGVALADFVRLVSAGEARGLMQIKGVGQKLAQRLIVELKDRIGEVGLGPEAPGSGPSPDGPNVDEAAAALIGLGASPLQARKTVAQVVGEAGEDAPVEEIIRLALRRI